MAVYKDNATGTWRVIYRFTNWKGERKQTQKRGFATKREAQAWDTTFESSGKDNSFISIFGHSLDPTDRNILKPFLDLKDIPVYIYYLNEMNRFELEKNLLKILGKELFSTYLAEKNPKIQFKKI